MSNPPLSGDSPRGLVLAIATYIMWGFLPLFMKELAHVPPTEVIAHRVLWSLPIALAVLLWQRRWAEVGAALRQPRLLVMAVVTAALISLNWMIYVWAVGNNHALDAALGYYINPLFSVALGATLLRERLNRAQLAAIALAALAVVVLTVQLGRLPLVAIGLTLTWGIYAYCKKSLPLGPTQGFTLEVLILTPFALAFVIWLSATGQSHFATGSTWDTILLIGCGPVTAVPLICYATAAKQLRLTTIGILQYIAPTMIFLTAVLIFGETFGTAQMIAFPMIWAALVIYTLSMLRGTAASRAAS
ncbi:EamA family transporter RarD [Paracoccus benzoatiresistens]|uniref:EamA family transporter RarD n=1 Tax=Paracoccus benzoatiresistens TaxID=2997341 RepID=A0ABT4J8N0_9RHOB|nr:EamA family transporter RarD [Paracoccus sp. EF6]MCZ0962786.1 EamA family transporter RarD [Paracoccus sp. EF6]